MLTTFARQVMGGMGLLAGLGAGLTGYAYLREPFDLRLERLTLWLPGAGQYIPASGLRLLHLSDSHFQGHNRREQNKIERVRRIVRHLDYDLLIHTGDFLHTDAGLPNVLDLLDALPRPRLGSYAVLGNHDYARYDMSKALLHTWQSFQSLEIAKNGKREPGTGNGRNRTYHASAIPYIWRFGRYLLYQRSLGAKPTGFNDVGRLVAALEHKGIQMLNNRSLHLQAGSKPGERINLHLAGIDDLHQGHPDLDSALAGIPWDRRAPDRRSPACHSSLPLILLSHNPDVLSAPETQQADLVLAGHTHGGQIVLPMLGAAYTQADHLSRKEASGYLRRGRTQVYINRGLGEGIPLRLGAPPQVTLITLRPA